jgi:hypothetical protein
MLPLLLQQYQLSKHQAKLIVVLACPKSSPRHLQGHCGATEFGSHPSKPASPVLKLCPSATLDGTEFKVQTFRCADRHQNDSRSRRAVMRRVTFKDKITQPPKLHGSADHSFMQLLVLVGPTSGCLVHAAAAELQEFRGPNMAMHLLPRACQRHSCCLIIHKPSAAPAALRAILQPKHHPRLQVQQAVGKQAAPVDGPIESLAAASSAVNGVADRLGQCMPAIVLAALWVSTPAVLQTLLRRITVQQQQAAWD